MLDVIAIGPPDMKLYITFTSAYARLARILVIEKTLEDRVEIIAAKTRTADSPYYRINPSGRVPYLIDDSGVGMENSHPRLHPTALAISVAPIPRTIRAMADRWRIAVQAAGHFEEAAQTCVASEPPVWGWGKGLHLGQTGELSAPRVRLLPSTGRDPFWQPANRPAAPSIRHRVEATDKRAKG